MVPSTPRRKPPVTLSVPGASTTVATSITPPVSTEISSEPSALNGPRPDFPATAPAANPVFYRTYSRKTLQGRESWHQVTLIYCNFTRFTNFIYILFRYI